MKNLKDYHVKSKGVPTFKQKKLIAYINSVLGYSEEESSLILENLKDFRSASEYISRNLPIAKMKKLSWSDMNFLLKEWILEKTEQLKKEIEIISF